MYKGNSEPLLLRRRFKLNVSVHERLHPLMCTVLIIFDDYIIRRAVEIITMSVM